MSRKTYKFLKWVSIITAIIFVIFAVYLFCRGDIQSGFAFFSATIAMYAVSLAFSSEEKMIALTNLNFIEKHAMMQGYIGAIKKISLEDIKKCKLDFEAAIEVNKWASNKRKEAYIYDLIELTNSRLNDKNSEQSKQTVEEVLKGMIDKAIESKIPTEFQKEKLTELKEKLLKCNKVKK